MSGDLTRARHAAGEAVLRWIAANTGTPAHTVLALSIDEFHELPEAVQAHLSHRLQNPSRDQSTFLMPAGILARYALGLAIPEPDA